MIAIERDNVHCLCCGSDADGVKIEVGPVGGEKVEAVLCDFCATMLTNMLAAERGKR